jgi:GDP-D-mannose dehydratase
MVNAMKKASGFEYKYQCVAFDRKVHAECRSGLSAEGVSCARSLEPTYSGHRTGDVPDLTADPSLAQKELGFEAPRNLEEMCRDLWNW